MEVDQIISEYLEARETDYAIMINGDWGSGKTYYWKNDLRDLIGAIEYIDIGSTDAEKSTEKEYYEPIYVSLYGLSDISDLGQKIFLELNPFWKKKGVKTASNIGKLVLNKTVSFFGIDKFEDGDFEDIYKNLDIGQNKVICFDDLERLSGKILQEVFGFINQFTEHDNAKVIIICNEEEIRGKIEEYDKVKEKLVRFTYHFKPVLSEIYPSFAQKYEEEIRNLLLNLKQFICGIYDLADYKNLRTLRFNLDILSKAYPVINILSIEKYKEELLQRVTYFTTAFCIEYKTEENKQNLAQIESISSDNTFVDIARLMGDSVVESEVKDKTYSEIFTDKYLPYGDAYFIYFESIARYIQSGVINVELLNEELMSQHNILTQNEEKEELIVINRLNNILKLEDHEFQPLIDEALAYVKEGKYNTAVYPNFFVHLLGIEKGGVGNFIVDESVVEIFLEGISKSKLISSFDKNFKIKIPLFDISDERYERIKDAAITLNDSLDQDRLKAYSDLILEAMKNNDGEKINQLIVNTSMRFTPIFFKVDHSEFFELTIKLSNSNIGVLNDSFCVRYTQEYETDTIRVEKPFFIEYLKLVNARIEEDKEGCVSSKLLKHISSNLQKVVDLKK